MAVGYPAPLRGEAQEPEGRMMARVVQVLRAAKRIEARISNSLVGDAIAGVCVAVMTIVMVVSAGVLQ